MAEFPIPTPDFSDISPSLQKIIQQMVEESVCHSDPFLVHMLGIPGSGKSSFIYELLKIWKEHSPVLLGFDQVMEKIPEYQLAPDKKEAFGAHELPAREAGYYALKELLHKKANILFDNGGSAASHLDLLRYAQDKIGYRIAIVSVVSCPLVARERILRRYEIEGRYTPHEYLEDRAEKIMKLKESYSRLTPHYYETENMGNGEANKAKFFADISQMAKQVYQELNLSSFSARITV
jgi:hypothetical protein